MQIHNLYKSKNNNIILITEKINEEYKGIGLLWDCVYNMYDKEGKIFSRGTSMFDLVEHIGDHFTHPEYFL
jgi:hypothetical protein